MSHYSTSQSLVWLTPTMVPPAPWSRRYRCWPLSSVLILAGCLAIPAVIAAMFTAGPIWISPLGYVILAVAALVTATVLFLVGFSAWQHVRAAVKPGNWTVQIGDDGLYLKLRSWLNWRLSETGPTVVFVPYAAIGQIRELRERLELRIRRHVHVRYHAFVVLTPRAGVDVSALERAVREEVARVPYRTSFLDNFRYGDDVPVYVDGNGEIRVSWRGRRLLRALAAHLPCGELESFTTFGERILDLGDESAIRSHLLDAVLHGERINATQVLQFLRGMGWDKAQDAVQEILRDGTAYADSSHRRRQLRAR